MKLLIAEDEQPARNKLIRLLADREDISQLDQASDGLEALEKFHQKKPDIILLDIQMPELSGIEVAMEIGDAIPIIFITAFNQYAVDAFELSATDYLLKPYTKERLYTALDRAVKRIAKPQNPTSVQLNGLMQQHHLTHRLLVKQGEHYFVLDRCAIDWVEAQGNYMDLHVGVKHYLLRDTMEGICKRLGEKFIRIHRSTLVNIEKIEHVEPLFKGDYQVTLFDGTSLRMSRHYREEFFARFDAI